MPFSMSFSMRFSTPFIYPMAIYTLPIYSVPSVRRIKFSPMSSRLIKCVLTCVFTSVFSCTMLLGNVAAANDTSVDLKHGAKLYKRLCTGCHGADGRGGAHTFMPHVSKLTEKGYIDKIPDDYLALVISKGGVAVGKSSYMPAWESKLSSVDIKNIIAHIRSLPSY